MSIASVKVAELTLSRLWKDLKSIRTRLGDAFHDLDRERKQLREQLQSLSEQLLDMERLALAKKNASEDLIDSWYLSGFLDALSSARVALTSVAIGHYHSDDLTECTCGKPEVDVPSF